MVDVSGGGSGPSVMFNLLQLASEASDDDNRLTAGAESAPAAAFSRRHSVTRD